MHFEQAIENSALRVTGQRLYHLMHDIYPKQLQPANSTFRPSNVASR